MDWQEKRDKFWEEFDLWDDANEPVKYHSYVVYRIELPTKVKHSLERAMFNPFMLWVGVDDMDMLHVEDRSIWFGTRYGEMSIEDRRVVIEYLVEWELAEWRAIGPEDSELFATEKLIKEEDNRTWR